MNKFLKTLATGICTVVLGSTVTVGATMATSATASAMDNNRAQVTQARNERRRARAGRQDQAAQRKNTRDVRKAANNFERLVKSKDPKKRARGLAIEKRIVDRFKKRNARQEKRAERNGGSFL